MIGREKINPKSAALLALSQDLCCPAARAMALAVRPPYGLALAVAILGLTGCNTGSGDGGASQRAEDAAPASPTQASPSPESAGDGTPSTVPTSPAQSAQPMQPSAEGPPPR